MINEGLYKEKILGIKKLNSELNKLIKILDVSELNQKVVIEIVAEMNRINKLNINGLIKYDLIVYMKDEGIKYFSTKLETMNSVIFVDLRCKIHLLLYCINR